MFGMWNRLQVLWKYRGPSDLRRIHAAERFAEASVSRIEGQRIEGQ